MKDKPPEKEEEGMESETPVGEFLRNTSWLDYAPRQEMRVIKTKGSIKGRKL